MTTAPQLNDLFAASTPTRTLQDVHADLNTVVNRLQKDFPDVFKTATALFPQRRKAMTDVDAAEELLAEIRQMIPQSTPVNLPFPQDIQTGSEPQATPVTTPAPTAPAAASAEPEETPSDPAEQEADEDDGTPAPEAPQGEDDGREEPGDEATTATSVTPTAASQPTWPNNALGAGLFSQLAYTLAPGETLQLVMARSGDQLLVTVQPSPISGENGTALEMQLKGTPAALDEGLITSMQEYREGRALARETATYADRVKAAAEAARKSVSSKSSSAKPTTVSNAKSGTLYLEVSPKDAVLVLTDDKGQTHPVTANKDVTLNAGNYTLSIDAQGYEHAEEKLTIKVNSKTKKGVVLRKATGDSGLF